MSVIDHKVYFSLLGIPVRDTVIMTWIMIGLIVLLTLFFRRKLPHLLELILDFIYGIVGGVMNVDNLTPYIPVLGTLFIFVLMANSLSIIPGLRSPTADVNTTFAMALIIFFQSIFSVFGKKACGDMSSRSPIRSGCSR